MQDSTDTHPSPGTPDTDDVRTGGAPKGTPPARTTVAHIVHKPLTSGKTFYLSEFLAERFIQLVAFASIAAILGIFYYVFHESTYAFTHAEEILTAHTPGAQPASGGDLQPESYGGESPASQELKPETYGSEPARQDLKPETYGSEPVATQDLKSGTSGDVIAPAEGSLESGRRRSAGVESASGDKPVTVGGLFAPNDVIKGRGEYIWQPVSGTPKYSFVPLFAGALKVTLIALLLAVPVAVFAAMYTSTFAPRWAREVMKPAIEILAGFPSVVIGFFALITLASWLQGITGSEYRLNAFVGGVAVALAVIPIVFTVTEDSLQAVPRSIKEASMALGASRWQTAWRVVLPAAVPGVFAAVVLGFGRAFGETMIALMATGNAALVSADILESVRTMSATIGAEMAEVEFHSIHYGVLFLIGAALFAITFTLNAVAEFWVRNRLLKRFQGS